MVMDWVSMFNLREYLWERAPWPLIISRHFEVEAALALFIEESEIRRAELPIIHQ